MSLFLLFPPRFFLLSSVDRLRELFVVIYVVCHIGNFWICLRHKSCLILLFESFMSYALSIFFHLRICNKIFSWSEQKTQKIISCVVYGKSLHQWSSGLRGNSSENERRKNFSNFSICNFIYDFFLALYICHFTADYVVQFCRKKSHTEERKSKDKVVMQKTKERKNKFSKSHSILNARMVELSFSWDSKYFPELVLNVCGGDVNVQRNKIYGKFKFSKHIDKRKAFKCTNANEKSSFLSLLLFHFIHFNPVKRSKF